MPQRGRLRHGGKPSRPGRVSYVIARAALLTTLAAVLAGCGSSSTSSTTSTAASDGLPLLDFRYDASAPLGLAEHGVSSKAGEEPVVKDISFRSQGRRIDGFLVEPAGSGPHPGVVVVHGGGGDRSSLLEQAKALAQKDIVALTITEPSTSSPPVPAKEPAAYLEQVRDVRVRDVIAVRRAVDVLQSLPAVDPERIGYLGWSAGGLTGTYVAAAEPRVKALALLSTGAAPLTAFVSQAPANLRGQVRRVLGRVDPLRYVAHARPGSVLLEDGRNDEVVPRSALLGVANAAPNGTIVRWYDAPHALDAAAYRAASDWLARKLA
jgi:uncharacterized protein